jgi:predicted acyl esterase
VDPVVTDPAGPAFDPIAGGGACATADGADLSGAASYRLTVPDGGFTLVGSPTVIGQISSPGPNSQLAARLVDVGPGGDETLVARGLYRPEVTATPARQVFQLHPVGWRFAPGHVAKLELLPADTPYGRVSNGQLPVTVTDLRLRLPVRQAPRANGTIKPPAPKVLPAGYTLAPGY